MILERILALFGLALASPILLVAAVAIVFEDGAPVFFQQRRIGRHGRPFPLYKLRSMRNSNAGAQITSAGDSRITRTGRFLRAYKLDELPQLWNVVRGDMSLIGPRPEVPNYVDPEDPVWQKVLSVRPGITDLATLIYRSEEEVLAASTAPEAFYRSVLLPQKLQLNLLYLERRSFWSDVKLLYLTVRYSFWPAGFLPETVRHALLN